MKEDHSQSLDNKPRKVETSIAELEISKPDGLGLVKESLDIYSVNNGLEVKYLTVLKRPFSGQHLVSLLDRVAPHNSGGISGIRGDFEMPKEAKRELEANESSYHSKLHRIHLQDPRIGSVYSEFVDSNLANWLASLNDKTAYSIHRVASGSVAINTEEFGQDLDHEIEIIAKSYGGFSIDEAEEFIPSFRKFSRKWAPTLLRTRAQRLNMLSLMYPSDKQQLMFNYLNSFSNDQKVVQTLLLKAIRFDSTYIDFGTQTVAPGAVEGTWSFENRDAVFTDRFGAQVSLEENPERENGVGVSSYEFPDHYSSNDMYPLVAWATDRTGQRRWLSQREVSYLLSPSRHDSQLLRGDVFLGRTLAAYFSPQITGSWPKEISLEQSIYDQRMMGAQIPVWVSLKDHAKQLLHSDVIDKLESATQQS